MSSKQTSSLLALPPELRDLIYEYAYTDLSPSLSEIPSSSVDEHKPSQALLLACKETCNDAVYHYKKARISFWGTKWFLVGDEGNKYRFTEERRDGERVLEYWYEHVGQRFEAGGRQVWFW